MPLAKRDLGKLGIDRLEQLERPIPEGIVATVRAALRKGDDGAVFNRVVRFDVVAVEAPTPDPFALDAAPAPETGDAAEPADGEAPDDAFDWSNGKPTGVHTR